MIKGNRKKAEILDSGLFGSLLFGVYCRIKKSIEIKEGKSRKGGKY